MKPQSDGLYTLRSRGEAYTITKLSPDFEVESAYTVSPRECDCPRGAAPTCRHRKMLPVFLKEGHVGDGWFFDFHLHQWIAPLEGEAAIDDQSASADTSSPLAEACAGAALAPPPALPPAVELSAPAGGSFIRRRPLL